MMNIEDLQSLKKQLQPQNIPLERRTKIVGNQMIEGEPFPYLENIIRVLRFDTRLENAIRLNELHNKFTSNFQINIIPIVKYYRIRMKCGWRIGYHVSINYA